MEALLPALTDIERFSRVVWPERALRPYQVAPARAIVRAALGHTGETLAVVFSRQSGKDELLAQVFAYLLILRRRAGGQIVVAQPSLVPQGRIALRRLTERLAEAGPLAAGWHAADGEIVRLGAASVRYCSAAPGAQARGATADLLLVANEAQDIDPDRWDAVFDPMGAATNAASVFSGTVWTAETLLARAIKTAEARGTVYRADWRMVARWVPAYGDRVRARIAALGAEHPFVRTEYRLLPLEGGGALFDPGRIAQMRGTHPRQHAATPGATYALLVDVGGGERIVGGRQSVVGAVREPPALSPEKERDSTALTVVEVSRAGAPDGTAGLPVYRVVDRRVWTGTNHVTLAAEIADLAGRVWGAARVVVDATGIGHGLAAMLAARLGAAAVVPFVFSAASKSDLGWRFLAAIGAGRYREYVDDGADDTRAFWRQVAACTYAVRPGPGRPLQWSVPERAGHDDLLLSAALVAALDDCDWRPRIAKGRTEGSSEFEVRSSE